MRGPLRGVGEWFAGIGLMIVWPLVVLVVAGVPLTIFWLAPPIVWLAGFGDMSFTEAAEVGATLAAGPQDGPQPPWGLRPVDRGVIGLLLFNIVFWLVVLAPVALALFGFVWLRDRLSSARLARRS